MLRPTPTVRATLFASVTPRPSPSATPTRAATATPAPIAPAESILLAAEGLYVMTDFETEGFAGSAAESGAEEWLVLHRGGAADYIGRDADGEWREWRGMPVVVSADGVLRFALPEDFPAFEMTGEPGYDGTLSLSLSLRNPDGTTGGSTHTLRRIAANDGADAGRFNGRQLSAEALAKLKQNLDPACMPFCTTVYACPEEIDWTQVFYNGAGLNETPSEKALAEYRAQVASMDLDKECIRDARVREFVWKHTLTSYDFADLPLFGRWFSSSDGWYIFEHGDTNALPVDFYEGYADGDLYKLRYMRADWENFMFDRIPFELTVYIRDGRWQYVSNLPAEQTAPKTLLTLSYYSELADAEALNNVVAATQTKPEDWMEPYGWAWAVFTAQTDGVRYAVEQVSDYTDAGLNVAVPGKVVASGVLNRGESAAVYTGQPWHAEMRLTAKCGAHFAAYVFGEDNWKHLYYDDVRGVIGHDLAGEGRGCAPKTEAELSAFLRDGDWALFDRATGELAGAVTFYDYRNLSFRSFEGGFDAFLTFDRFDARPTEAPDVIAMEYTSFEDGGEALPGYRNGDPAGEYQLHMVQLDGEQVLTLTQISEGDGIFTAACPEAGEGGVFTLHRYKGTPGSGGQG